MAKDSSFDIVSQVDTAEITNAVTMATKEIQNRYDFKGSKSSLALEKEEIVLVSDDEYKLEQLKDVLLSKLIKRGISVKSLDYGKISKTLPGERFVNAPSSFKALTRKQRRKLQPLLKIAV
ncbi:DUF520 family protein [Alkalihalobacillus oceani]|uniref:DUF520 family protein n=1 Tax=Halalkalibacter oceani TaxID=1653776 RepID=A0A9X2DR28_9BACI|nr:DUF520 family protein [Halalkalibacter oceani]MCM3713877.1 DUF520 family protein [Halalkalibacter oceani]